MARFILSAVAAMDVENIWARKAQGSVLDADQLIDRIDGLFITLASRPNMGQSAAALLPGVFYFSAEAYLIFYREVADGLQIVRLLNGFLEISNELFREDTPFVSENSIPDAF